MVFQNLLFKLGARKKNIKTDRCQVFEEDMKRLSGRWYFIIPNKFPKAGFTLSRCYSRFSIVRYLTMELKDPFISSYFV